MSEAQPASAPPSFGVELSAEVEGGAAAAPAADAGGAAGEAGGTGGSQPGARGGEVSGAGAGASFDVAPQVVGTCAARYPHEAAAHGRRGQVVVEVHIEADGWISRAEVVESMGPAFDREALAAMRACRYLPAALAGQHVASVIEHRFTFTSQND